MATNPAPFLKWRAFDANGDPLSGGLLYTYAAGTTNNLATYTTRAGGVANANPVVLDANGEADVWLAPGVDYKFVLKDSLGATRWTEDNIPSPAEVSVATSPDSAIDPGGRLTLTTALPVTTADVTAGTTVYYVPYKHNKVPLYDGSAWTLHSITTELSQTTADSTKSPAAVAASKIYDCFIWDDAGTLRCTRGPLWDSDTSRGTGAGKSELEYVNGRLVNKVSITNGPGAQRGLYVGSIRSNASSQIADSYLSRVVDNFYNPEDRPMRVRDAAGSWTITASSAVVRANASAANQCDFLVGWAGRPVRARVQARGVNSTATPRLCYVGIGLDTIASHNFASQGAWPTSTAGANWDAEGADIPAVGYHYLAWLETGNGTDNQQFFGSPNNGIDAMKKG